MAARSESAPFLYRQVVGLIVDHIDNGTLRPGDRLPSLRKLSRTAGVSVPTVRQAYVELERQRRVEARPKSGFFVRHQRGNPLVARSSSTAGDPVALRCRTLMERVYDGINDPGLVPLGIANPSMAKPAAKALHRTMRRIMARGPDRGLGYASTLGEPALRRQLALHYLDTVGATVDPDEVCITNGGQEALLLALRAVTAPGDVVAVESPTYHGLLELIDSLGLLAVEVETCPEEGVTVSEVERTLTEYPVAACVFSTTLGNPLGVTMPDDCRRRLVDLLAAHDVALVEDDVYGELRFDGARPMPAQFLDGAGTVLTCGSFSKTVAPGYRVGWVVAGEAAAPIARLKRAFSCSSGYLQQLTLADFLASGLYNRYISQLQMVIQSNYEIMASAVAARFPSATRTAKPVGGSVLWLELPTGTDSERLFDDAVEAGISIAPGQIFSPSGRYRNCVRLSFGHPWGDATESALGWLGERARALAG